MVPVKTLSDLTLDFVANNAVNIETLIDFPSCVGQLIFYRCIELGVINVYDKGPKILRLFVDAYGDEFLSSLCLKNSLICINEHLEQFLILTENLTSLDLSGCQLGCSHEMIEHVSKMTKLKNLSLRSNCLSNNAIRKICLPMSLFQKGPTFLEVLDLSENPELNDKMIPWLYNYKHLQWLNLTNTNIKETGCHLLRVNCSLELVELLGSKFETFSILTQGWAECLIESWFNMITRRAIKRLVKERMALFYNYDEKPHEIRRNNLPTYHLNKKTFIFKRTKPRDNSIPCCEKTSSPVASLADVENLFDQYK